MIVFPRSTLIRYRRNQGFSYFFTNVSGGVGSGNFQFSMFCVALWSVCFFPNLWFMPLCAIARILTPNKSSHMGVTRSQLALF